MKKTLIRTLSVILSALMLLASFTACDGGKEPADNDTGAAATDTSAPATDAPTGAPTEPETEPPVTDVYVVRDGKSFPISCNLGDGLAATAAYILREYVALSTGVTPEVTEDTPEGAVITFETIDAADTTGDCGYTIRTEGEGNTGRLIIAAPSLAGFENAFAALTAQFAGEGSLLVPIGCETTVKIDSGANYVLDADDFKPENTAAPFYNDKNDSAAYVCNTMWHMFGAIDDGQSLVYRFGNEPTWYEWMSEKIMWSGNQGYINELKSKIQNFPQTSVGYMWAWSTYPYWKVDDCYSIHYDGTFRIISAAYDVISWENSTDFLSVKDSSSAGGQYAELDASKGRTVLEKVEAAWDYILYQLHGETGVIRLTEESTYLNADGSERFDFVKDTGKNCWNNTGLPNSASSNYWDNLCFGNYDAYESALFYDACDAMIGIYTMLGGEYLEKLPYLNTLKEKIKSEYDRYFWSEEKGRYIECIDTDGNKVDFGFTFVNFEALKYGLGDAEKAKLIFDWVDGDRIIEGEDRTGKDIMSYATLMRKTSKYRQIKNFDVDMVLAPVVNTVAINNKENKKTGVVWWHGPAGIDPWAGAAYGAHCENGGYIFYPVFYELMARTQYEGAQSTTDRLRQIARVYEFNRLNSDEAAGGAAWLEGLVGEFPESGLVPTTYISALMGVRAEAGGLYVEPHFNEVYEKMGVTSTTYGGKAYGIEENRNGTLTVNCLDGAVDMVLHYKPAHFEKFTVNVVSADGTTAESEVSAAEDGFLTVTLSADNVKTIVIEPLLR